MLPSPATRLRWIAFRAINALASRGSPTRPLELETKRPLPSVWIFISTIGELNAIEPFLRELAQRTQDLKWVLLTDRSLYREAYNKRFPDADVVEVGDGLGEASVLARLRPPRLLVVAEIPLLPSDAPCRLSFSWLLAASRHGARLVAVNGWLYGYPASCRSDALERRLLSKAWLELFDRICVQTEDVADRLIAAGARTERITVTGNIKFDALDRSQWQAEQSHSPKMLADLLGSDRPLIVAGCVTDADEQELILSAFARLKLSEPRTRLVLAPRHPENPEVMASLASTCARLKINPRLRSELSDDALAPDVDCLILNTMGDLKHFYGAADIAHVGRNHNVLEALAFGTPVTVRPGWEPSYPSYPVYRELRKAGALHEADTPTTLEEIWRSGLGAGQQTLRLAQTLTRMTGASARTFAALAPLFGGAR